MTRFGFIHDKLDIKILILYLMARVAAPIDFAALTDLALCDEGVDYFLFAEAVSELVATGHMTLEEGRYAITEKGKRNGSVCEDSLPYSVRQKSDLNLSRLNAGLRRNAQVRAQVLPRPDGTFTLHLSLDDDMGNLLTLDLLTASREQGDALGQRFLSHPEQTYHRILNVLLSSDEEKQR
jgi:hypothetical protein